MKLEEWLPLVGAEDRELLKAAITQGRTEIEGQIASAVGDDGQSLVVAVAMPRGLRVLTVSRQLRVPDVEQAFNPWPQVRQLEEVLIFNPGSLGVGLSAEVPPFEMAVAAKDLRPFRELAKACFARMDQTIHGPTSRHLRFEGGVLADGTFRMESRTPLPDVIADEFLGDGRYIRSKRVENGGAWFMHWEPNLSS